MIANTIYEGKKLTPDQVKLLRKYLDSPIPSKRTEEYYQTRPCEAFVRFAAEIIENEKIEAVEITKPVGFVSVCAGDGLAELFKDLGVDTVVSGGQTMNPSTEDILNAVDKINVFCLVSVVLVVLASACALDCIKMLDS